MNPTLRAILATSPGRTLARLVGVGAKLSRRELRAIVEVAARRAALKEFSEFLLHSVDREVIPASGLRDFLGRHLAARIEKEANSILGGRGKAKARYLG